MKYVKLERYQNSISGFCIILVSALHSNNYKNDNDYNNINTTNDENDMLEIKVLIHIHMFLSFQNGSFLHLSPIGLFPRMSSDWHRARCMQLYGGIQGSK